jgi:hypothetical protein
MRFSKKSDPGKNVIHGYAGSGLIVPRNINPLCKAGKAHKPSAVVCLQSMKLDRDQIAAAAAL